MESFVFYGAFAGFFSFTPPEGLRRGELTGNTHMSTKSNGNRYIAIGLMLFALFFGAGNLIFPAAMGQSAGVNVWWALLGFCITGVGLPVLGVMAMGYSGCRSLQELASRVHPLYGLFYTIISYMAIGPCFAVPRTGTVSFEIAVRPFLPEGISEIALPIFLAIFFVITFWLSATPSKLVDRVGKLLTPALVLTLGLFILQSFVVPMGEPQAASKAYATPTIATIQGILDGYNTLDAIASLIFAVLVISAVKESGVVEMGAVVKQVYKSGLLAGFLLAVIYAFVAKIGAESVTAIGMQETGAPVLAERATVLFGNSGALLLAAIVLLACLTTAVGLVTCCAAYFQKLTGKLSYVTWAALFCVVSYLIGLFGLKTIIVSTIPVLMFIYPLCMALMALAFMHNWFDGRQCVYVCTMAFTFVMALISGLETANVSLGNLGSFLHETVPLYSSGLGWISFAVAGAIVGLFWKTIKPIAK